MCGERISIAVVRKPETRTQARLVEIQGKSAEVALEATHPIFPGALVEFETNETLYLGSVESNETKDQEQRLHINLEHSLDLTRVAWIQKLWNGS